MLSALIVTGNVIINTLITANVSSRSRMLSSVVTATNQHRTGGDGDTLSNTPIVTMLIEADSSPLG
jgi:hypothetical protein